MIAFTLELINLFILLKGLLGYDFRKNHVCVAIGIGAMLFHYAAFLWFSQEGLIKLDLVWLVIPIAAVILFFRGKPLILLGIGVSMRMVFNMMNSLSLGVWILAAKGDVEDIDLVLNYNLSQAACIVVLVILTYVLRKKRERIHSHVERLNPLVFVPFVLCSLVLLYNPWYIGSVSVDVTYITQGKNLLKSGLLTIFIIIFFVMIYTLISQRKEMKRLLILNEKCIQEQAEQYRFQSEGDQALRKFRHDYNDHVAVLHDLAQHGDDGDLRNYARQMGEIKDSLRMIYTGNIIGDAIVNRYDRMCQAGGIEMNVDGVFPGHMTLSETDLCVLLSNGIRNAYEAAKKCGGENAISVDIQNSDGYVYIIIRNPSSHKICTGENGIVTSKGDKENHGYGTKNMLETARKNDGDVSWEMDKKGIVTTTIMLKNE